VDREVCGLALAHLVTLLLHGPDIVGAAACLHRAFGEEGGVWVCVAAGVSWRGLVSLVVGLGGLGMCKDLRRRC
jgi:hypothetical protein